MATLTPDYSDLREANLTSLYKLLCKIAAMPSEHVSDEAIRAALKSQGELAKYANQAEGINPTSLNTLKRHSEKWLIGGYATLDAARQLARERLDEHIELSKRTAKRTKKALEEKIQELAIQTRQGKADNLLLAGALRQALQYMRAYAEDSKNPSIIARAHKESRELIEAFSLMKHPVVCVDEVEESSNGS